MSNNAVIVQADPPMSPPPLGSHSIPLLFPPGSQTSPVLGGVRALQQDADPSCKISYERETLRESHFNLTLLQVQYSSYIQAYKAEIATLRDTLEIWLL